MLNRKTPVRAVISAIFCLACLLASAQAGAAVSLSLSGAGDPDELGFGARGLYLGGSFSGSLLEHPFTNWTWSDLEMTIQGDGDATISGNMVRDYNAEVWGVNIELGNIEYREVGGGYRDNQNWSGSVDQQSFLDLAQGIDPFSGANQSSDDGWGFEWQNLSMTLDKSGLDYDSHVPDEGWEGFAMPNIGHALVAELHYDGARGLTFEAWYRNPQTNSWYDVGDTKAIATVDQSTIPEPLGLLLLSGGLFGIGATRIRRQK